MKKRVKAKVGKMGFTACLYEIGCVLENNEIVKDFKVQLDRTFLKDKVWKKRTIFINGLEELDIVLELLGLVRSFIPDDRKFDVYKSSIDSVVSVSLDKKICKYRQDESVKYARDWLLSNYVNGLNIYNRYIPCNPGYV